MIKKERPRRVRGETTRIPTGVGRAYIIVTWEEDKVFEVFIQLGKTGSDERARAEEVGRLVSMGLRYGIPADEVIDQLKDIKGANPVWYNGELITGVGDAVSKILQKAILSGPPNTYINLSELILPEEEKDDLDWMNQLCDPRTESQGVTAIPHSIGIRNKMWALVTDGRFLVAVNAASKFPTVSGRPREVIEELISARVNPETKIHLEELKIWAGDSSLTATRCPECRGILYCPTCKAPAVKIRGPAWIGNTLINRDLLSRGLAFLGGESVQVGEVKATESRGPFVYVHGEDWKTIVMGMAPGNSFQDADRLGA